MKKKFKIFIIITTFCLLLVSCNGDHKNTEDTKAIKETKVTEPIVEVTDSPIIEFSLGETVTIGGNDITLKSIGSDFNTENEKLLRLNFTWKNNSKESKSFEDAFIFNAFQDGTQLKWIYLENTGYEINSNNNISVGNEIRNNLEWFLLKSGSAVEMEIYSGLKENSDTNTYILKVDISSIE